MARGEFLELTIVLLIVIELLLALTRSGYATSNSQHSTPKPRLESLGVGSCGIDTAIDLEASRRKLIDADDRPRTERPAGESLAG
jgi:hypothetical protein